MAKNTGKRQVKPTPQSTQSQVTSTTTSSIPKPFVPAPTQLRALCSTLPTDHLYTFHLDPTPIELKRRVFAVPVLLNLCIIAGLLIRVYYAAPVYLDQIITIWGYETAWKVEPKDMSYQAILNTVINRTGLLMIDYAIFGFIGSWPAEFFFGSKYIRNTGPVTWRRKLGFRDTEIIARKGRKWDAPLFAKEDQIWSREDELSILTHVEPAMRKSYTSKTGYLLLDKDWDLDFKSMIDAQNLVEKGKLDVKDLEHIVLVYYHKQWLLWQVHDDKEPVVQDSRVEATIANFRAKLVEIGHEDVFFRWVEIIQYETSLHGGFGEKKQREALQELRRLLKDRKVNSDEFLQDVGGVKGVPGLTITG